jgi:DNA ligase (NAD+)
MNLIELSKTYKWNIPTKCPVCGGDLTLSENHKQFYCNNDYCKSKYSGRITKWTSVLGIKEFGMATIEKFLNIGIINTISSLYKINYQNVTLLEGFGEKSADNLKNEIESHKKMTLSQFIAGYNIDSIGEKVVQKIIDAKGFKNFGDFYKIKNHKDFICEGVGDSTALKLFNGLAALGQDMLETLRFVEIIEEEKVESSSNSLNGKSFCFTGAMKNKRKDLEAKVIDFGGIVHDGIKKNPLTDYLVIADINSTSSKAVAARKLGVNLISEDNFLEMCK